MYGGGGGIFTICVEGKKDSGPLVALSNQLSVWIYDTSGRFSITNQIWECANCMRKLYLHWAEAKEKVTSIYEGFSENSTRYLRFAFG